MADHPPEAVVLSVSEARMAAGVGIERRLTVLLNGGRDRPTVRTDSVWTIDVEGAGAELAFAKVMGWYWDGSVGVFHHRADVRHVHVRRQREHTWDMCIRPGDLPGPYALVTGIFPRYLVHGWACWPDCPSYEAAPDPGRPPANYVRQADLRDLAELTEEGVMQ